jgi:hypothetical protein
MREYNIGKTTEEQIRFWNGYSNRKKLIKKYVNMSLITIDDENL